MKNNAIIKVLLGILLCGILFIACRKENNNSSTIGGQVSVKSNVGVLTLTGIPIKYEGNYILLFDEDDYLMGAEKINEFSEDWSTYNFTLPRISNGEVFIPMWNLKENLSRYTGNHTFEWLGIEIYENPLISNDVYNESILLLYFIDVTFANGNSTLNWTSFRESR